MQTSTPPAPPPAPIAASEPERFKFGLGIRVGLLGPGIQGAMSVSRRANVRVGYNYFSFSGIHVNNNGANYSGGIQLRSLEAHYDWFPFAGGFHLSPGVLAYDGNNVSANVLVKGGQTLTLNHVTYTSDPNDPLIGSGGGTVYKASPMFLMGWGNLVPRRRRKHISGGFEFGAVYQGPPKTRLAFTGSDCDSDGLNCQAAATDPGFQSNLSAEVAKYNKDASSFRFYPVLAGGIGYKF